MKRGLLSSIAATPPTAAPDPALCRVPLGHTLATKSRLITTLGSILNAAHSSSNTRPSLACQSLPRRHNRQPRCRAPSAVPRTRASRQPLQQPRHRVTGEHTRVSSRVSSARCRPSGYYVTVSGEDVATISIGIHPAVVSEDVSFWPISSHYVTCRDISVTYSMTID